MHRYFLLAFLACIAFGCADATQEVANNEAIAEDAAAETPDAERRNSAELPVTLTESSETATEAEPTRSELATKALRELQEKFQKSQNEFMVKVRRAPREEQMQLFLSGGEKDEFAVQFLDLAKEYMDEGIALGALQSAAQNGKPEVATTALDLIVEKFADDKKVLRFLRFFERVSMPAQFHEDFLVSLAEKTSEESIKGSSKFALIKFLQSTASFKDAIPKDAIESLPQYVQDYVSSERGEEFDQKLIGMLEDVKENFADVKFGRGTLGDLAGEELFVFKYLSIGKEAPDIEGVDLDGEPFKLSDYRGKVVMLDFWGDW